MMVLMNENARQKLNVNYFKLKMTIVQIIMQSNMLLKTN